MDILRTIGMIPESIVLSILIIGYFENVKKSIHCFSKDFC